MWNRAEAGLRGHAILRGAKDRRSLLSLNSPSSSWVRQYSDKSMVIKTSKMRIKFALKKSGKMLQNNF